MLNSPAYYPVVVYLYHVLWEARAVLSGYLSPILCVFGCQKPFVLLVSMVMQPILDMEFLSHYQERYAEFPQRVGLECALYGAATIRQFLQRLPTSMATWNLLLFQAGILRSRGHALLGAAEQQVLNLDSTTLTSFAAQREGAEVGFNRRYKGKPCYQLLGSFLSRVFVDVRLLSGSTSPKVFCRKAVKRALALGYRFHAVRGDSTCFSQENLRVFQTLSLGYTLGAPATVKAVKEGKRLFQQKARQNHYTIVPLAKGVSALDVGIVPLAAGLSTRLIIIRRITRRKDRKTGTWRVRTYFYALATSFSWSVAKVYTFYHQRQRIESAFKELKQHYFVHRLPVQNLQGNEFWIATKILAMTVVKLFQLDMLPKAFHHLMRRTLIRRLFSQGWHWDDQQKVHISPQARHQWLLRRLFVKIQRIEMAATA
jgi:hypothetical protein